MDLEDEDEYRHLVPVFTHMVMSSPREREKTPNELILIVKDKLDGCVKKKNWSKKNTKQNYNVVNIPCRKIVVS